jgi:hypothetical protein
MLTFFPRFQLFVMMQIVCQEPVCIWWQKTVIVRFLISDGQLCASSCLTFLDPVPLAGAPGECAPTG